MTMLSSASHPANFPGFNPADVLIVYVYHLCQLLLGESFVIAMSLNSFAYHGVVYRPMHHPF